MRLLRDRTKRSIVSSPIITQRQWTLFLILVLICVVGLGLEALAGAGARLGASWAEPVFWVGLLVIYVPIVMRLAFGQVGPQEGASLVVLLGLSLYLVKILHSPLAFTFSDEFTHWRTTNDILRSGHLFQKNPILPVSALFPGLEVVTSALVRLSGLSIFAAGAIVIGVARVILSLALYFLYSHVSHSTRVAGLASALYMTNANYLFFGAMFKYESLALAAAAFVIFALHSAVAGPAERRTGAFIAALLGGVTVVTTHHLTGYILSAFLVVWVIVTRLRDVTPSRWRTLALFTALFIAANLVWLVAVAPVVVGYIAPHVDATIREVFRMIWHEQPPGRVPFQSSAGFVTPVWERAVGYGSALLVLFGLPFGWLAIVLWHRHTSLALTLGIIAAGFPASLALRFTGAGWEIANRSSEFAFIGIAFTLAVAVAQLGARFQASWSWRSTIAVAAGVVFIGGVIAGWPPRWRLPWPYRAETGPRSVDAEVVSSAFWTRDHLGPDNVVGSVGTMQRVMGAYGEQTTTNSLEGGVNIEWVLYAPSLAGDRDPLLQQGHVHYLIVDKRLAEVIHRTGYYPNTPVDQALAKFDQMNNVSKIFDSGDVVIYDVSELSHVP